jgi:hypothetical protein
MSQTGYAVAINQPLTNNNLAENPQKKSLIIIASCNATLEPKDLEGWVGQNSPAPLQYMVASLSGTGRQTITFVVPWEWYYRVVVSWQSKSGTPAPGGIPPGGICNATAWWME